MEDRSPIVGRVKAFRNGIGVEALITERDQVKLSGTGQDGTLYLRIGFGIEIQLDARTAAALKAVL